MTVRCWCPYCLVADARVLVQRGSLAPADRLLSELPGLIAIALAHERKQAFGQGVAEGLQARPRQGARKPARARSGAKGTQTPAKGQKRRKAAPGASKGPSP
jgi:hypothetical protein